MLLRSEQGIVSLAPLSGYPLKAKDVTMKVTPFAYFTVLRTMPKGAGFLFGTPKQKGTAIAVPFLYDDSILQSATSRLAGYPPE